MVEVIANLFSCTLIDGLSFKLAKTASYINNRKSCTFRPQWRNIYNPSVGVGLIQTTVAGHAWLDPSTLRILFDLQHTNKTAVL